jgi:hypothetical protein
MTFDADENASDRARASDRQRKTDSIGAPVHRNHRERTRQRTRRKMYDAAATKPPIR